jgi:hypothetical protein
MGLENVNRCQHVKVNGTQCGSPALRRRRLCFFHVRCQQQRARIAESQFKQARFLVPVLEDANAVQMALMQVMQLLSTGQMEHKTAALMLYALQTASCNLRNTQFEADDVMDVVIDRNTVDATCIGGPQWVEEDFDDTSDETEEDHEGDLGVAEEEEAVAQKVAQKEVEGAEKQTAIVAQGAVKVRAKKAVEHVSIPEARKQVQGLIRDWLVETVEAEAASKSG